MPPSAGIPWIFMATVQETARRRGTARPSGFDWQRWLVPAAGLVLLVCLCYAPAIGDGFIWDDDFHVTDNPELRSLSGLARIWFRPSATPQYYPLVHTVFWLEYHIWGFWAPGFHAVNLALHLASTILLWRLLGRLAVPASWFVAAIWAVHPLNVETVAWVSELKNVLSTFFYLAALSVYLRFWAVEKPDSAPGHWRNYLFASALFLCALLSKTVACTLPAAILLLHYWKRGRIERRAVLSMLPWFAVGLVFGLTTAVMERTHVGASGPEWAFSPIDRVLIAGRAICFYAAKLLVPSRLTFIYPRWTIDAGQWWQYLFPMAAIGAIAGLFVLRRRLGRGPLCALLFFYGTLFPALGFLNVYPMRYSFVADHFQYLAGVGWLALVVSAALAVARLTEIAMGARVAIAIVLCIALGVGTWQRAKLYRDGPSIWWDTISKNPSAAMAYGNLAKYLSVEGNLATALPIFQKCVELSPFDPEAHSNLGQALEDHGELDRAIDEYRRALRLDPRQVAAHCNLGYALLRKGLLDEAETHLRRAIELKPKYAEAHNNLGTLLWQKHESEAALKEFGIALDVKPDYAQAFYNRGTLLMSLGRDDKAQDDLMAAVRLNPKLAEAHNNLGSLRLKQRQWAAARDEFRLAVRLNPGDPAARQNLAAMLEQLGDFPGAVQELKEAIRLDPSDARPRQNLGRLLGVTAGS